LHCCPRAQPSSSERGNAVAAGVRGAQLPCVVILLAAGGCNCTTCKCGLRRISSVDSDATADNLPGPGRNLGLLLGYLGRKLERGIGTFAARCGHGPDAVADAIARLRLHHKRSISDMYIVDTTQSKITLKKSDMKKLRKKCNALSRYTRATVDSTAISTNNHITDISIYDPLVRKLLHELLVSYGLDTFLNHGRHEQQPGVDLEPLLASSQKALISVTEVGIQKLMSEFYVAISSDGFMSSVGYEQWLSYIAGFATRLEGWLGKDVTLSFLGLRHISHGVPFAMQAILESINVPDQHDLIAKYSLALDALALALVLWLCSFDSPNRVDIPTHAIDWDSLEAFLGAEGKKPTWSTSPGRDISFLLGHTEFHAFLNVFYATCIERFSTLCQRHGRKWAPPQKPAVSGLGC